MPKLFPNPRAVSSFTAREIASLMKRSRSIFFDSMFSIKTSPREYSYAKILVVTPKKMGSAPQRNLMKRRLKSLFYEEKLFQGPINVIVYCKKESYLMPYKDLKILLSTALSKASNKFSSSSLSQ